MYIENGNTLVVKSGIEFYEKERSGKKPNTWRYFGISDGITKEDLDYIHNIRVINQNNPVCCFTRKVIDTSFYKLECSGEVLIISWEHSNGTN